MTAAGKLLPMVKRLESPIPGLSLRVRPVRSFLDTASIDFGLQDAAFAGLIATFATDI
jgi:hypothetical protein